MARADAERALLEQSAALQRCRAAEEEAVRLRAGASDAHARLARTDRALHEESAWAHPRPPPLVLTGHVSSLLPY